MDTFPLSISMTFLIGGCRKGVYWMHQRPTSSILLAIFSSCSPSHYAILNRQLHHQLVPHGTSRLILKNTSHCSCSCFRHSFSSPQPSPLQPYQNSRYRTFQSLDRNYSTTFLAAHDLSPPTSRQTNMIVFPINHLHQSKIRYLGLEFFIHKYVVRFDITLQYSTSAFLMEVCDHTCGTKSNLIKLIPT